MSRPLLFLLLLWATLARGASNVTILAVLPYAIQDTTGDIGIDVGNAYKLYVFNLHAAVFLAARDIRKRYNITVNVIPVNNWDPRYGTYDTIDLIDSGGYSADALYRAVRDNNNVLGIIGDLFSRTTKFTASVASQYQLPFCGATQGSTTLSNKKSYPYFWRMQNAKGSAKHYITILKEFGMKHICIFQTLDDLSASLADDMKQEAEQRNVAVSLFLLRSEGFTSSDFDNMFSRATRLKCHFFYTSMNRGSLQLVYDAALKKGFVGSNYLWSSVNVVVPVDGVNTTHPSDFFGYFFFGAPVPPNPVSSTYWEQIETLEYRQEFFSDVNFTDLQAALNGHLPEYTPAIKNCMEVMFEGMYQLKAKLNLPSIEDVRSRSELLNYTAFRNTGVTQEDGKLVVINEYGDLAIPTLVVSPNKTNWENLMINGEMDDSDAFGITSLDGETMTLLYQPTFFDGTKNPPIDESEGLATKF
ncbi:hypothetical protein HDU97_007391 [Phlyctochytrium planicorne]|nr:hypothetical protein HDU97_007391 [Phlyctochytrium planicorne]